MVKCSLNKLPNDIKTEKNKIKLKHKTKQWLITLGNLTIEKTVSHVTV